jgi:hypothetical protein
MAESSLQNAGYLTLQVKYWTHFLISIPAASTIQFPSRPCKVMEVIWLCKRCQISLHLGSYSEACHAQNTEPPESSSFFS